MKVYALVVIDVPVELPVARPLVEVTAKKKLQERMGEGSNAQVTIINPEFGRWVEKEVA
jgi:hypothetical protein